MFFTNLANMRTGPFKSPSGLIISLLLIILFWHDRSAYISTGLDGSYFAFFNYFFFHKIEVLQNIQYPYGPLGFLINTKAVGYNLIISYVFWSTIKVSIFYLINKISDSKIRTILLSSIVFYVFENDFLIYLLLSLLLLNHNKNENIKYLLIASLTIAIGLLIKVTIGTITALIVISYCILQLKDKKIKSTFYIAISFSLFYIILWTSLFKDLSCSFSFLKGQLLYILNNGDAVALFPENNWWAIVGLFVCFFFPLIINKEKPIRLLYLIHFLALFAIFKYSFGRQENYHSIALFHFIIYFIILYLSTSKKINYSVFLLIICLPLYYINLKHNQTFHISLFPEYGGISAFNKNVIHYESFKKNNELITKKKLEENILPESMLNKIGSNTIDFFPWDLTYYIPNQLNYLPHSMLQTGGFPFKMVKENAMQLGKNGPKFILWEKEKWNGEVGSVDKQYLFNVDGFFVYEIFNHYKIVDETKKVALLKRTEKEVLKLDSIFNSTHPFNHKIKVPNGTIVRVKVKLKSNLSRKILSAIYKVHRTKIEYILENDSVIEYEITESAMKNGLWISPYLHKVNTNFEGYNVSDIRFTKKNIVGQYGENIELQWQIISKQ